MELDKYEKRIAQIITTQPKNIIHKKQILLFPENGAREYYRIVFGRFFFWMLMFLLAFFLFALGKQFISDWKDVNDSKFKIIDFPKILPNQSKGNAKHKTFR